MVTASLSRLVYVRSAVGSFAGVASALPADGVGVAVKLLGNGHIGQSCTQQGCDLVAFFLNQVLIGDG